LTESEKGQVRCVWQVIQERTKHEETQMQGATWCVYKEFYILVIWADCCQ